MIKVYIKIDTSNIFMKYFFFKEPSKLMRYLSNKIVSFYRKIDFEV